MDAKSISVNPLKGACRIFQQDLESLPAEAFAQKLGGKARTVADITFEVMLVNDHVGMVMRGEEPFAWPEGGWITAPENLQSKEAVTAAFAASTQKLIETVEAFSEEQFTEPLATEDGETTRTERCRFMTLHLWYHSGQLNFIQTLLGDDNWNWK